MVLPGAVISGRLCHAGSGEPFDGGAAWTALLKTAGGNTLRRQARGAGSDLRVASVAPGSYRLTVSVPGFASFTTDLVDVGAEEALDLGEIALSPCGLLELEITGAAGNPLEWLSVECNQPPFRVSFARGRDTNDYRIASVTDRIFRITDLPTGRVELTIGGAYCLDSRIAVDLPPGRAVRATVALRPEP